MKAKNPLVIQLKTIILMCNFMKSTLIAGILLLLSLAGIAQPQNPVDEARKCEKYSLYWTGIGAGVAGLTTLGYYKIPNDQNFIVKTGSVLGAVCLSGVVVNLLLRNKFKNQMKAGNTTFHLEPAKENIGLVLRF